MRTATCPTARSAAFGAALIALTALAGCDQKNAYDAPPPPKVTVAAPVEKAVTLYLDATGNTAAVNTTNLVARVPGFLETVNYKDGVMVKKGTVLFTIEPESFDRKRTQAQAAEGSAQSTAKQTQSEYDRQNELVTKGSASKSALDNATANRDTAQANLQQAQINTKLAALNMDYSSVKAPFDGVVTARKLSVGEYVGANSSPTVLATIVQLDPVYANFSINEKDTLRIRAQIREKGLTPEDLKKVPVEIGLQTELGYPHKGTLDYASPTVDATTGTLSGRGLFDNPGKELLPGLYEQERIPTSTDAKAK